MEANEPPMSAGEDPYRLAIRYWAGLGAPAAHVAAALRRDEAAVAADLAAALSPLQGLAGYPSAFRWPDRTLAAILRRGLNRPAGEQLVFVAGEGALGVGETRALLAQTAAGLAGAGVGRGDLVAVDATQRLESLLVAAATLLLGAAVVRLSLTAGIDGVRAALAAAPPRIAFTETADRLGPSPRPMALVRLSPEAGGEALSFADWLAACPAGAELPEVEVRPQDIALIGFTSGSTGAPKQVATSHLAAFRSTEAMAAMFGFDRDDVFCTSTDFSALSAFRSMLTAPFFCGGRVVIPSAEGRTQPLALAEDCAAWGVTRLTAVPNVLRGMAQAADRLPPGRLARLRTVFSGSGVLDQATRDAFHAKFPVPVIDYYGGREFATALYARADTGLTVSSGGGAPCNCLVAVVDDEGAPVADGEVGEIMVHSDCLASGDLAGDRPEWRGWHQTGDLGRIAGDGLVRVVGRRRDVIKAADGGLVFPAEIEALIGELPDIREACVMGFFAADGRERIVAAVLIASEAATAAEDVERATRAHVFARAGRFRTPERVFVLASFPRTGAAKIDKPALRGRIGTMLGDVAKDVAG